MINKLFPFPNVADFRQNCNPFLSYLYIQFYISFINYFQFLTRNWDRAFECGFQTFNHSSQRAKHEDERNHQAHGPDGQVRPACIFEYMSFFFETVSPKKHIEGLRSVVRSKGTVPICWLLQATGRIANGLIFCPHCAIIHETAFVLCMSKARFIDYG